MLLSRSWVDARGVGTALTEAAVAEARRLGAPALFLEGSPVYYASRGFEPATPRGFTRLSARIPEPAFQVVVLEPHRTGVRILT